MALLEVQTDHLLCLNLFSLSLKGNNDISCPSSPKIIALLMGYVSVFLCETGCSSLMEVVQHNPKTLLFLFA